MLIIWFSQNCQKYVNKVRISEKILAGTVGKHFFFHMVVMTMMKVIEVKMTKSYKTGPVAIK